MTNNQHTMKKTMILGFCLMMGSVVMAQQQRSASGEPMDPREQCIMAEGLDWAQFGVDADQVQRINTMQSDCKERCTAAKRGDGELTAVIDDHVANIRQVLTEEQFTAWNKWCMGQQKAVPAK